jgi:hypothetical protein
MKDATLFYCHYSSMMQEYDIIDWEAVMTQWASLRAGASSATKQLEPWGDLPDSSHTSHITRRMVTLCNLFANPIELDALRCSFAEEPNWKAMVVEDETWEGTTEENVEKWQGLVGA